MRLDINANVQELNIAQSKCVEGKNKVTTHCKGWGRGGKEIILLSTRINCKRGQLIRECGEYMKLSHANLISSVAAKIQECCLDEYG